MRLTTKSEYTLLALIHLARHARRGYVSLESICRAHRIPKKYIEQLFMILRRTGFVRTRRGPDGGYALARPAKQVVIADIIRLMDGALAPTESVSTHYFSHTPLEGEKKLIRVMRDIRDYIAKRLEHLTLENLV